jgi:Transglutaminase-like superfamily
VSAASWPQLLRRSCSPDAITILRSTVAMWRAEFATRALGLRTACRWLGVRHPGESALASGRPVPSAVHQQTQHRVTWALRLSGLPDTCLRRALVAGYLTQEYRPTLRIGVRSRNPFEAHAWLEYGGVAYEPGNSNSPEPLTELRGLK